MIEGVSDIQRVMEPAEQVLNIILVAGPGGIANILAITACARFPAGPEWCFFVPSGASGRSGDWKLSIEIKFSNAKPEGRPMRARPVDGASIGRTVASWMPRRRAASDRIGGYRGIASARARDAKHRGRRMTRNEQAAPVTGYLRLSGIDR